MTRITTTIRSLSLPLAAAALLLLAACGGSGDGAATAGHDHGSAAPPAASAAPGDGFRLPATSYPPAVAQPLETALDAYEAVRERLADDTTEGVAPRARRAADALGLAVQAAEASDEDLGAVLPYLGEAHRAAEGLAAAAGEEGELEPARAAFGELTRFLMAVAGADAELTAGRHVFACPMVDEAAGFNKWIQVDEAMENPYMGQEMPTCGSEDDWSVRGVGSAAEAAAHAEHVHGEEVAEGEIAFWTCPMHPSVRSADPGACPICGMDLVAVTAQEAASGVILVDERRRQLIGVKTRPVERRPLATEVRAVGRVTYDETRLADVSVKYRGWIGRLHVDQPGQPVRRGQPLFTLYSPELYAAQQEYLTALASQRASRGTAAPERADYLVRASRERLRLWDLAPGQIDHLAATGEAIEQIPILSPVSGVVVEKNVVEGAAVEPGVQLFRIAGLDRVWVEAEVYESELPLVEVGQPAVVTLPSLPGEALRGTVAFVYPWLDGAARTGKVRIELPNPGGKLKPDMFADVTLVRDLGERLAVPEGAVLYAGPKSYVFLDLGEGRLRPQRVETGREVDGWVEVLSGLAEGDVIVTSGNFLIAAESRLKVALDQWQ